jgi:hypothetical protein
MVLLSAALRKAMPTMVSRLPAGTGGNWRADSMRTCRQEAPVGGETSRGVPQIRKMLTILTGTGLVSSLTQHRFRSIK